MDDVLQEALARRGLGTPGMAAGGGVPATQQFTQQGRLPSGGSASPVPQPGSPMPIATGGQGGDLKTVGKSVNATAGAAQLGQSPAFDEPTRELARALATRVIANPGQADDGARKVLLKRLVDVV